MSIIYVMQLNSVLFVEWLAQANSLFPSLNKDQWAVNQAVISMVLLAKCTDFISMWNPFFFFFFWICISYIRLNLLNKHCITKRAFSSTVEHRWVLPAPGALQPLPLAPAPARICSPAPAYALCERSVRLVTKAGSKFRCSRKKKVSFNNFDISCAFHSLTDSCGYHREQR